MRTLTVAQERSLAKALTDRALYRRVSSALTAYLAALRVRNKLEDAPMPKVRSTRFRFSMADPRYVAKVRAAVAASDAAQDVLASILRSVTEGAP
jgi:hypothetical protein